MSKATDFINNKCYQLGNPIEPLIFKADALEAVNIASKEIEERAVKVYRQLCPCYQNGKCQALIPTTKNKVAKYVISNVIV